MVDNTTPDDVAEIARYLWRKEKPTREMDEESAVEIFLHYDTADLLSRCGIRISDGEMMLISPPGTLD